MGTAVKCNLGCGVHPRFGADFLGSRLDAAHLLARANLVTNKNLLPSDTPQDWDRPSGLRMGTIEVTRYGVREPEMGAIVDFMARVLVEKQPPESVIEDVIEFRQPYQTGSSLSLVCGRQDKKIPGRLTPYVAHARMRLTT